MKTANLFSYMLIVFILIMFSCNEVQKQEQEEIILARIGEITISLSEFVRRAELTIRPPYCKGDNNIHKKIILNSLVAEKMLALEAGEINELDQNKNFQLYIQGRQEQAMREWLLHEEGFQKVQLEESEIQKTYGFAGRTYNVQYFNIPDNYVTADLKEELTTKVGLFEALHQQLWPDEDIPQREVTWKSNDHPMIYEALFSDRITKGSVIGPLMISKDNNLIVKVMGWIDQPAVTQTESKQRWNYIKEELTKKKALQLYDKYVGSIMIGKKLEFEPKTFSKWVNLVKPFYSRTPNEKRELFLDATFDRKGEIPELSHLADGIETLLDKPFFIVEDQVWSVRDFKEELQRHPLVFRKNVQKESNFSEQFKFAVIDMIRDSYLTQEAYKRGYHEVNVVKRNRQMWHDALMAQYQKNEYLKSAVANPPDSLSSLRMIEDYLNPYIDRLQEKYSDRIRVNVEEFNKISLTRIDMIVMQNNVPFPIIVPNFPQVTTDSRLNYGKGME